MGRIVTMTTTIWLIIFTKLTFHLFSFKERLRSCDLRTAGKLCIASGQFSNSSLFCKSRGTSHLSTNMMISPSYRTCWGSEFVRNFSELLGARRTILQEPLWQAWLLDINFLPHIGRVLVPYDSSLTRFTLKNARYTIPQDPQWRVLDHNLSLTHLDSGRLQKHRVEL
jgi:hypothetical protein